MKLSKRMKLQTKNGRPTGLRTPVYIEELVTVNQAKGEQAQDIANLTVTHKTDVYDADESSVNRMTNAERQLAKKDKSKPDDAPHTKLWKLHDNSKTDVTADDLSEVLDLAAAAMDVIIDG